MRELYEVDQLGAFFDIIHQDPVLSQVKLIAEPWDVGTGGHQVGNFPVLWSEWNGKYRDTVRQFWKGNGFTLHDLVSYNDKHNDANGDEGQDGANESHRWNCGAEGPTDDPAISALRWQ